jgi:hypothetical protein
MALPPAADARPRDDVTLQLPWNKLDFALSVFFFSCGPIYLPAFFSQIFCHFFSTRSSRKAKKHSHWFGSSADTATSGIQGSETQKKEVGR